MDVRVIKIEEDGFVWVSQASIEKLRQLEDSTATAVSRLLLPSRSPEDVFPKRGDMCAVYWKDKWRRGIVETLYNSAKYNKVAQVFLLDHGVIVSFPLAELVGLQLSSISGEPPLAMKYHLHPLTATPVSSTKEEAWSELVEDIFVDLHLTNDGWGYLTKGLVNDDGTLHLFNEGLDVSINEMLVRRRLLHIEEGKDEDFTIKQRTQKNEEVVLSSPCSSPPPLYIGSPNYPLEVVLPSSPCSSPPPLYIESPNYPLEMTSPQAGYMDNLKIPHSPKSASKVYIDGTCGEHVMWSSLEETPFNTSICKRLQEERGFRYPTSVQSNGWYYIWKGYDTVLCSPHHSGKTLSYLLPLLSLSCKKRTDEKNSYEPEIIVLADDSYKTWNINDQAKTILSWFDAAKRFRTSFLFATVESEAHVKILNGVDILVATPPALIRLVKREVIAFRSTRHLVLDDVCLFDRFPSEMNDLLSCCMAKGKQTKIPLQLVACSSSYSEDNFNNFLRYSKTPVTIMTDMIEVLVMKKVKMNVLFCEADDVHRKLLSILKVSSQSGPNVICVGDENEAQRILQVFSLYSFQLNIWRKEDNTQSFGNVTVVLDSSLPTLLSTGTIPVINQLINYSLPSNKSIFKRRLSLLLSSLKSPYTPSLSILLSHQCFNQSHAILRLCERFQMTPPPELVAMGAKRWNEVRRDDPLWGVCHQVKCYGRCRKVDCIHVHSFEELSEIRPSKLSPALVPTDGVIKVLVKAVASPCHLWVEIIDHTPLDRGQTPCTPPLLTLTQISMDLSLYYSEPNNRVLYGQPSVGDYLCLNSVSGTYYRVLVLLFSRRLGLYFHHKEQAKVRLVDTGEELIVDVNQLYTLPLSFLATPPLVVEAYLCGMIPPDNDTDWPSPSVDTAKNVLLGRTLTGGIAFSLQSSIWLDPVEERSELHSMGVVIAIDRPQRQFIREGVSLTNTDHISMIKDCLADNDKDSQSFPLLKDMVTETPPNSPDLQVKLTAIESLDHFYIQLSSADNNLRDIVDRLNISTPCQSLLQSFYPVPPMEVGMVCAAKFPFDDKWYRVVIMEKRWEERDVERGEGGGCVYEYLCFFADYGDCEWVGEKSVQPIDRSLLQLPFQAICCSLNNPEGIEFSENAHEDLWELIQSQLIKMKILDSDPSFCSSPFPPTTSYSVGLETNDGSSVISLLLTNQNASSQSDEPPGSELSIFLNLLLFNEGELVSSFFPFIISKHAQIELTSSNCEMLAKCVNEINSFEVINGLSLIASSNHNSAVMMADDGDLCEALLNKLKRPSKTQIPALKLLFTLFLSSRFISLSYGELQGALCHLAFTERSGPLFSLCSDFLACLNTAKKIVITEDQVERFFDSDKKRKPALRLVCSLLHTIEGCRTISQYLPHILHCFKDYSKQLQESLLLSLLASSLFYPVLLTHHISAVISSLKPSMLSSLCQLLSFKDIAGSFGPIGTLLPINGECLMSSEEEEEKPKTVVASRNIVTESPTNKIENLVPKVLWSQNRSQVVLNVPLRGCSRHHVDMKEQTSHITARCVVEDKQYKFSLELFDNIEQVHSKQDGSGVIIKLKKSRLCYWPCLTSCKVRPSFIGVDHDRWKDSSSSDDEEITTKQKSTSLLRDTDITYDSSECNSESDVHSEGSYTESEFEDNDELLDFLPS